MWLPIYWFVEFRRRPRYYDHVQLVPDGSQSNEPVWVVPNISKPSTQTEGEPGRNVLPSTAYCIEGKKMTYFHSHPRFSLVFLIDRCCEQTSLSLDIDSTATRTMVLQTYGYMGNMINHDLILPSNYIKLREIESSKTRLGIKLSSIGLLH